MNLITKVASFARGLSAHVFALILAAGFAVFSSGCLGAGGSEPLPDAGDAGDNFCAAASPPRECTCGDGSHHAQICLPKGDAGSDGTWEPCPCFNEVDAGDAGATDGANPDAANSCVPGSFGDCTCGNHRGIQVCLTSGTWNSCVCDLIDGGALPDGGVSDTGVADTGIIDGGALPDSGTGADAGVCSTPVTVSQPVAVVGQLTRAGVTFVPYYGIGSSATPGPAVDSLNAGCINLQPASQMGGRDLTSIAAIATINSGLNPSQVCTVIATLSCYSHGNPAGWISMPDGCNCH